MIDTLPIATAFIIGCLSILFLVYKRFSHSKLADSNDTTKHPFAKKSTKKGYMTGTENMFVKLENNERLQTIAGFLVFEETLSVSAVHKVFDDAIACHPRLKQRTVQSSLLMYCFEDCENFNINDHVLFETLPDGSEATLKSAIEEHTAIPFDKTKPLWQSVLFTNYGPTGDGCVLFIKMHHCVGDGMAANLLLAASAVDSKGVKFSQMMKDAFTKAMNHHTAATKGNANNNNNKTTWKTSRRNFVHAFVNLQSLGVPFFTAVISLVAWVILRPLTIFKRFFASVKSVYISLRRLILDLIHLLGEKKTVLVREPTKEKSIAWSSALSLADVKVVKDAFGVTVNDVLVAALTGALRRHIIERGEVVPYDVFCPIPVTLRKTVKDVESLQNNVAGVWHFLPTGIEDPVARLHEIHKRMEERKKNKIYIAFTVFNMEFWGRCPQSVATGVVNHYWGKSLAIITNVPGPQSTLYLGGAKITDIQIFGLQACYGGMAISIITYDGKVSISIVADRNENAIDTPARQLCDTKVLTQFEQDFKVYLDLARAKMETSKQ